MKIRTRAPAKLGACVSERRASECESRKGAEMKAILVGGVAVLAIAVGIYFSGLESPASDVSSAPVQASASAEQSLPSMVAETVLAAGANKRTRLDECDLALPLAWHADSSDAAPALQKDGGTAIPPVSDEDITAKATGEYSNQINQEDIVAAAKLDGYLPQDMASASEIPPISDENVSAKATGEYADQINQDDIIAAAKIDGFLPQVMTSDSEIPPTSDEDVSAKATGEYADQINQEDITAAAELAGRFSRTAP
jgi:hypothetical protein